MIKKKEEEKSSFAALLKRAVGENGIESLTDPQKVNAILMDIAPYNPRERKLIFAVLQEGVGTKLLEVRDKPREQQEHCARACILRITGNTYIHREDASYAVGILEEAIGIDCRPAFSEQPNNAPAPEASEPFSEPNSREYSIGDIIIFGSYKGEQIKWQVLDKTDGRLLLLSKYALEYRPYHAENASVNWEECSLRAWLNNDFYNKAFSEEEKANILTINIVNMDNTSYGTNAGSDTQDRIFLLSIDEVQKYFAFNHDRICKIRKSVWVTNTYWWLRSPGFCPDFASCIDSAGRFAGSNNSTRGHHVTSSCDAVRPAMWIKTYY